MLAALDYISQKNTEPELKRKISLLVLISLNKQYQYLLSTSKPNY